MCKSRTTHEQTVIRNFKLTHEHICHYCGKQIIDIKDLTVDHLTPSSRGGLTIESNLVISCGDCNLDKGDMTESEYFIYLKNREKLKLEHMSYADPAFTDLKKIYNNIINKYNQINESYKAKIGIKRAIEKQIESSHCNAAEGYCLYRKLQTVLLEIKKLECDKEEIKNIYSYAVANKLTMERLQKEMTNVTNKMLCRFKEVVKINPAIVEIGQ